MARRQDDSRRQTKSSQGNRKKTKRKPTPKTSQTAGMKSSRPVGMKTKRKAKRKSRRDGEFVRQVTRAADKLQFGTVLAIDPASGGTSMPGWALFRNGGYVSSGVFEVTGSTIQERLANLTEHLRQFKDIDVLVIERIRGRLAHVYLTWSVGVTVSVFPAAQMIECVISTWKKWIKDDTVYVKGDEADSVAIGCATIAAARELAI